jgi:hypothetical protein
VELSETLMLSPLLWAETAATDYENHWILPLEFRELPSFCGVLEKLIIGEDSAWNNVISHLRYFFMCDQSDGSAQKRRSASIANMN